MTNNQRFPGNAKKPLIGLLLILFGTSPSAHCQGVDRTGFSQLYSQFDLAPVNSQANTSANVTTRGATLGSPGVYGQRSSRVYASNTTGRTLNQSSARLMAQTATLDKVFGGRALPPTRLDSFVKSAAGNAELIYGDEGTTDIPPFFTFDESHRIERGVYSKDLTTGHKGDLPDAWGWPQ